MKNAARPALLLGLLVATAAGGQPVVSIDGNGPGRVFEGLGALSAGASSRLLIDYPEPQRSQVLDFLFKPGFGASLHHLKVEIGGDTQSTDGTEPSFARTREEFQNPKPEYFQRGYEWWLMREARRRNPDILLDILQWGAPGWIGAGQEGQRREQSLKDNQIDARKFYTQDNADFIAAFIKGAKQYHGVDINYCGIWNERPYDVAWIKLLRGTLDRRGLGSVKIVAADEINRWTIATRMLADRELTDAVGIVGTHYPNFKSTPEALGTGKPLWSNEDGFWNQTQDPWQAARILAKQYNRNYVVGRMTKTILWSLITSYYDNLPLPNSGLMKANQPWSGHYEVQPAIWATAHTTQFAQPGWRYIDAACALLPAGGSHVVLRSPQGDLSLIVETMDAKTPQAVAFRLTGGLSAQRLHVWCTTQREQFIQLPDVTVSEGAFTATLEPEAIYSFTTTTGQHKGAVADIPPAGELTLPYHEDFEAYQPGSTPKYLSDQAGVFEVGRRPDDAGQCLHQTVTARTIDWVTLPWPMTLVGSQNWTNFEVRCDARAQAGRVVRLVGRVSRHEHNQGLGYALSVGTDGQWALSLMPGGESLASGSVAFTADTWHVLTLRCNGPQITASVDGTQVARVVNLACSSGMAGVGAGGWYDAEFDNLQVNPLNEPALALENLARRAKATASSVWSNEYEADRINDDKPETRWNAAKGHLAGEWVELDFGRKVRVDTVSVRQFGTRITKYKLQADEGGQWQDLVSRECKGQALWSATFTPVETTRLRLVVEAVTGNHPENDTPSIYEIEAFDTSPLGGQT